MATRDVDTGRVIDEVRLRKCLWDASDLLYKNRDAKNKAWEDIAEVFFENLDEKEKKQAVKQIQQRWRTARDAFFKSKTAMRNQASGSSAKKIKKYIFYDELTFLNPSAANETDESIEPENVEVSESIASSENVTYPENVTSPEHTVSSENSQGTNPGSQNQWSQKRKNRQRQENSPFERELLTLLSNQTPDLAADDLAFFSSLGPILKSFDIEQKLEFRSRVLREATAVKNTRNGPTTSASAYQNASFQNDPYAAGPSSYNYMYDTPILSTTDKVVPFYRAGVQNFVDFLNKCYDLYCDD